MKLHIGCGERYYDGWVNIDLGPYKVDLKHDVTLPFPFKENSVDIIYSEHFIEHLTPAEGLLFLNNCFIVLKEKGVLRIATFNLDTVIKKYESDWQDQCWIPSHGFIKNKAEMLNVVFRWWDHKWIYNTEEMLRRISESKFGINVREVEKGKSDTLELCNLDTRQNSDLIVEAIKC